MSDEKDDKWEMPRAVFRSSEGSLPRSLEETISHSFMPNAETIEIDDDEDILSIMGTPDESQPGNLSDDLDHEPAIEIDHNALLEAEFAPEPEIREEEQGTALPEKELQSESVPGEAGSAPIVVTAKEPDVRDKEVSDDSRSNLAILVLFVLIAAALIGVYVYNSFQPPPPR